MSEAPTPLCSCEVYELVKDIEHVFGKPYKGNPVGGFKKKCKFWELPYWKDLDVRHCLDVMHIEKNVCDAIVETLLNIPGKSKLILFSSFLIRVNTLLLFVSFL